MENQFVTYKIAKKLKELGFSEKCFAKYLRGELVYNGINNLTFGEPLSEIHLAPLWQQVIDWLREKHELHISISRDGGWWGFCSHDLSDEENSSPESKHNTTILSEGGAEISDYYSQREKAILKALELIKKTH